MRKYLFLVFSIALLGLGLWLSYDLLFLATRILGWLVMMAVFLTALGAAGVWDTLRNWNS